MGIKIFLTDDHVLLRDCLCLLLNAQGDMTVIGEASDGREAVLKVEQLKPDVVLMDIAMPHLNGIEATRQIRDACSAIRVIILSMSSSKEHVYQALQAGASGYLMKESAGSEVVAAVRAVQAGCLYFSKKLSINPFGVMRKASKQKSPLMSLSQREREVLQLVVEGRSSAEVADVLFLSRKTVETYRCRLMQKLNIPDLPNLVKFAIVHGLTSASILCSRGIRQNNSNSPDRLG